MPFDKDYDRASGIGASEAWRAYCWDDKLFYEKLGLRENKEYIKPFTGNMATRIGHESEDMIFRIGCEVAAIEADAPDDKTRTHKEIPHIFATVDGRGTAESGERCVIEVKCVGYGQHLNWGSPDDGAQAIPNKVLAQIHIQMEVEETYLAYVFALLGTDLRVYRIEYDTDFANKLLEKIMIFWEWIEAGEGLPIGHGAATKSYLAKKYAQSSKQIRSSTEYGQMIEERMGIKERKDDAQIELDHIDNQLRNLIGQDDGIRADGVGQATFLFNKRGQRALRVKLFGEK